MSIDYRINENLFINSFKLNMMKELINQYEKQYEMVKDELYFTQDRFPDHDYCFLTEKEAYFTLQCEYGIIMSINSLEIFLKDGLAFIMINDPRIMKNFNVQIPVHNIVDIQDRDTLIQSAVEHIVDRQLRDCWKDWEKVYQKVFGNDFIPFSNPEDKSMLNSFLDLRHCIIHHGSIPNQMNIESINRIPGMKVKQNHQIFIHSEVVFSCMKLIVRIINNIINSLQNSGKSTIHHMEVFR